MVVTGFFAQWVHYTLFYLQPFYDVHIVEDYPPLISINLPEMLKCIHNVVSANSKLLGDTSLCMLFESLICNQKMLENNSFLDGQPV